MSGTDAIERIADHVLGTRYEDLPPAAVAATRRFLTDTLGVGVGGSSGPWVREHVAVLLDAFGGEQARVWVTGERLSAAGAAAANAYQIHNAEFDCVHEGAVVHTFTVPVAAALAVAEREGRVGGRELLLALALGVDVACTLGVAARTGLRFFRPGTAGAFGATAAVGRLLGLGREALLNAFGATLAQLCGTMQAHTEGSMALGLQIGFNARNAVLACDMARRSVEAPRNVLEGPFGYYALFEGAHDLPAVLPALGHTWRVTEVSHKPWPSGRATHGVLAAVLELRERAQLASPLRQVRAMRARVPPLVAHLVGRSPRAGMTLNETRLCLAWVSARALERGTLDPTDFRPDALADPATLALARRFVLEVDDNPDPNALAPVALEIELAGGERLETRVEHMPGSPARPLSPEQAFGKLETNVALAGRALPEGAARAIHDAVAGLEGMADVRELVDLLVAPS